MFGSSKQLRVLGVVKFLKMLRQSTVTINPVSNYSFGTKAPKVEKDTSVAQRMERLKEKCAGWFVFTFMVVPPRLSVRQLRIFPHNLLAGTPRKAFESRSTLYCWYMSTATLIFSSFKSEAPFSSSQGVGCVQEKEVGVIYCCTSCAV